MLKNDKVEWIWNYYKGKALLTQATPSEFLKHESDEFLDIVIEDICEYENWSVHGLITK